MENGIYWNAVRIHPHAVKKICRMLRKKGIHYYDPASHQNNLNSNNFLEGIIFVCVSGTAQLQSLKNASADLHIVYWLKQPAFFTNKEINLLRFFLESHTEFEANSMGVYAAETVQHFNVTTRAAEYAHNLVLPSLGYRLSARVKTAANIRLLRKAPGSQQGAQMFKVIPGFQKTWHE